MDDSRQEVIVAIKRLIQANLHARSQLENNERLLRDSLARLEAGQTIAETLRGLPTVEERTANTEAVRAFYARRTDVRTATIRAALDEGMSVTDLAAEWGIPHHVIASHVAKTASESDAQEQPPPVPSEVADVELTGNGPAASG